MNDGLTTNFVRREFIASAGEYSPRIGELFDNWLNSVKAEAWNKGYTSGMSNTMRRMSDEPNAPLTRNPYQNENGHQ